MRIITIVLLAIVSESISAQNIKFSDKDDLKRTFRGDVIEINTDTAYVVNKSRAEFLNQKLNELKEIQQLYNNLANNHNELFKELNRIQKLVGKLSSRLKGDSSMISRNLSSIIDDLDETLVDLKNNNQTLKRSNSELLSKIDQLEKIVSNLKKETRWMWWNGLADKIVTLAAGVGIGILVGAVLR